MTGIWFGFEWWMWLIVVLLTGIVWGFATCLGGWICGRLQAGRSRAV